MAKKLAEQKESKGISMIYKAGMWAEELELLYTIIRSTDLEETTKWGGPCFTIKGKNVLGIGGFKSYLGIWFYQGVFLKDEKKLLINAGEGKTKALRQWRFKSKSDMDVKLIKAYIQEAIDNTKAGKEMKPEKKSTGKMPQELADALNKNKKLKANFEALPPFKQREYRLYVSEAKQETTRRMRAEKSLVLIQQGKGLNDKYR